MTIAAEIPLMTTDEFLAFTNDGVERDLIRGRLRERGMTRRNRRHSRTTVNISTLLRNWQSQQPPPRGEVLSGEAAFRILRNPDTTVGIDVAVISAEMASATVEDAFLIEGAPLLAVEILSPSDRQDEILEKVSDYLRAGVQQVWVVEPVFQTISVYRPGVPPETFNETHELSGGNDLPGLRIKVADIFGR